MEDKAQELQGEGDQSETVDVDEAQFPLKRQNNTLPLYGNKETMNINSMILTNIKQSPYFKTDLFKLKTFHEVVDEIFYRVEHLEPWERNSRKLSGQVGMCAGVRGVASGGIVSTPFCLLFKLFTLKLTRKQVTVMLNHVDSPYIRGLGFLYIRYCQPPNDFWSWYEPYFDDEEEIDLKAGSGFNVAIGGFCRMLLTKQDWFGTMFPRIPVNLQKILAEKLKKRRAQERENVGDNGEQLNEAEKVLSREREIERVSRDLGGIDGYSPRRRSRSRSRGRRDRSSERSGHHSRSRSSERRRHCSGSEDRDRGRRGRGGHFNSEDKISRSKDRRRSRSRDRKRSRSRDRRRSRSRDRRRSRSGDHRRSRSRDRRRSRDQRRSWSRDRKRSRSRDRRRSRSRDRRRSRSRDLRRSRSRDRRRSRSRERQSEYNSRSRGHRARSRERSRSKDRKLKQHRSYSGERRHHRSPSNEL